MPLLQVISDILKKKSYDFDRPDVDIYNFHPQLLIILAMNGIFFNKRNSLLRCIHSLIIRLVLCFHCFTRGVRESLHLRFVWPCLIMGFSIAWLVLELIFLWHYLDIQDYFHATESFCYFVILGCVPMVFISLFVNSHAVYEIVDTMNQDYHMIRNLGPRFRKPFLEGQLRIWQLCCGWYTFQITVGLLYAMAQIVSLLYYSLFATLDENSTRPLQFPMWLPYDDPYRTPNYEIFLGIEFFIMACVVNTYSVYVYNSFHILLHYYIVMDMIILNFGVLFDGLEESVALLSRYDERRMQAQQILNKRIKNIVNMHLSVLAAVKTVSSVYGPALVYQVMFTSVAICLIAYQVAEKLGNGTFDFLFCALGMAACLQLWIPCYLGTKIRDKAFAVGDAAWECGWHLTSLGLLVRNDIIIIVLRAQQPVTIKFIGLPNVNLETFSGLMAKSYSYFNMVRQYSQQ